MKHIEQREWTREKPEKDSGSARICEVTLDHKPGYEEDEGCTIDGKFSMFALLERGSRKGHHVVLNR